MNTQSSDITVVVVEDHPIFREGVVRAIKERDGMEVVGEAATGWEAIELVGSTRPTVCVLDLGLPDIDGGMVLERLLEQDPEVRVLVLSGGSTSETVYSTIEAGASGYELKTAGPDQIAEAITAVARGEVVIPGELHGGLADQIRAHRPENTTGLSDRELEILREVAAGRSAAEIAQNMNLAESTIKTHLTRIYTKLGVSERAAAVAQAIRSGLID